jgi:hypothetical protein
MAPPALPSPPVADWNGLVLHLQSAAPSIPNG